MNTDRFKYKKITPACALHLSPCGHAQATHRQATLAAQVGRTRKMKGHRGIGSDESDPYNISSFPPPAFVGVNSGGNL